MAKASAEANVSSTTEDVASDTDAFKTYNMYYTTSRLDLRLHLGAISTPATYYLETSARWRLRMFLRRGTSKTSQMVAFAGARHLSRQLQIGQGDFERLPAEQREWEQLARDKSLLHRSNYQFGTAVGSGTGARAQFVWRKDLRAPSRTVYDAVDEKGTVVARLLSGGAFNWRKAGEIKVVPGLDQGLEELLLVSALAIWTLEGLLNRSTWKAY